MDQYIAKTFTGLETFLADELKELGATDLKVQNRGVAFSGTPRIMYRVNLESRLALKVLSEITSFKIDQAQDVYTRAREIEWEKFIPEGKTFAIDTDVFSSYFDNTMYAALICKDAIVDRIREVRDERPTVDKKDPDIDITLFIRETSATISLNSSGQSLHIRGYKKYPGIAPLSEVLAAGLIQITGWDRESPLINPMCGSGSLMIEAQRYARNIPSQINRKKFSFQHWPNYDEERWELILKGAKMRVNRNSPEIIGFDYNKEAIQGAKKNALTAGSFKSLQIYDHDFFKYEPPLEKATVILNPPYNVRLHVEDQMRFYNQINNMLYRHYKAYDNWIICPVDINLRKAGFRVEKEFIVYNGPIKCQFAKLSFASKRDNPNRDQSKHGGSEYKRPLRTTDSKDGSGRWDKPRSDRKPGTPGKWDKPRSGGKPGSDKKWGKSNSTSKGKFTNKKDNSGKSFKSGRPGFNSKRGAPGKHNPTDKNRPGKPEDND